MISVLRTFALAVLRRIFVLRCQLHGAEIGEGVLVQGLPYVKRRAGGRIIIRERAAINDSRWSNPLNSAGSTSLYATDGAVLELGAGVGISGCQIIATRGVTIGENSLVGAGSLICDSDMHEVPLGNPAGVRAAPIHIGRSVFIGARSVILKGVEIGDGAVIAAGSVVLDSVPAHSLVAGNPAKVVKLYLPAEPGTEP